MKILNFGSCNIDLVYSVEHIVNPGETISALDVNRYPGGKGLNQSIALANAGASVWHAGCIGSDGLFLIDIMKSRGVDTRYIKELPCINGQAFIQVNPKGENSIVVYGGSNVMIQKEHIDEVLDDFSSGDFILLQNEINNIDYIIDKAYSKDMKIVLNPSPFNKVIGSVPLEKISYLILNEIEAASYLGNDNVSEFVNWVRDKYPKLKVVLTLGKSGCIYFDKDDIVRQNSYRVDAVDTTAAGDTFTGYFIAETARGKLPKEALDTASVASAISVSRNGAASSIPTYDEVTKLRCSMTENSTSPIQHVVYEYFEKHYLDADINALAAQLGYSQAYLTRWLKKHTGKTFSQHILDVRCRAAKELLQTTDLSVSQIIEKVGYTNQTFFRKAFCEKYGVSPSEIRKKNKK